MSFLILNEQGAAPAPPASGKGLLYLTTDNPAQLHLLDDAGNNARLNDSRLFTAKGDLIAGLGPNLSGMLPVGANGSALIADSTQAQGLRWALPAVLGNANTADIVCSSVDTYLTGAQLTLAAGLLRAGSQVVWRIFLTKTNQGTAAPTWSLRLGLAGSIADTARATFTGATQTAAVDAGYAVITATIRSIGAAGSLQAAFNFQHNLATTGLATAQNITIVPAAATGIDFTVANQIIGLSINPAASAVWTVQVAQVELIP